MRQHVQLVIAAALVVGCRTAAPAVDIASLQQQVMDTERAFAATMANRDTAAFASFLAPDAIFLSGDKGVRGSDAVVVEWRPLLAGKTAPFSWSPDQVEVLESGDLALSSGPILDPRGNVIGRFNSIWRRDASGRWRVVFDKGSPVCKPAG